MTINEIYFSFNHMRRRQKCSLCMLTGNCWLHIVDDKTISSNLQKGIIGQRRSKTSSRNKLMSAIDKSAAAKAAGDMVFIL